MEWLLGFACLLVAVTVVGHGLWVLFAALVRSASSSPRRDPARSQSVRRTECPGCSAPVGPGDDFCGTCGLSLDGRLAQRFDRLRSAQREVRDLAERNELDRDTADRVVGQFERRIRGHREPAAERAATAAPPRARPVVEPVAVDPVPRPVPVATPVAPDDTRPVAKYEEFLTGEPPRPSGVESVPVPVPVPAADAGPRRGVLTRFMEDRNILVGELVGGLLIVGCSVALVLTLWRNLEALPYFPFLLSSAITGALFAAGYYTLHHWKLASTSRGLLIISLLLAPLTLLVLANPGTGAIGGWVDFGVGIAAALAFAAMTRSAGRDLIGVGVLPGPLDRRWLLALAVVGPPAVPVLFRNLPEVGLWAPLACHALACGAVLAGLTWYRPRDERRELADGQGPALLTFVGLSLFALVAAWGFLATQSASLPATLRDLAIPLALAAIPVLEAGLLVFRRADNRPGLRYAGTVVAASGFALLLAAGSLAWPNPAPLAVLAVLIGSLFTREAWRNDAPSFHAGAIPALGLAVVLGILGVAGYWSVPDGFSATAWLASSLGRPTSATTLVAYALALAAVAEIVVRLGRRPHAVAYAIGGLAAGATGLFLVTLHGPERPGVAAAAHAACAVGVLASNVRWRSRVVAEVGLWLILVGSLWALFAIVPDERPLWSLTVATESLAFALFAATFVGRTGLLGLHRAAAINVAAASGVVSLVLGVTSPGFPNEWHPSATLFILSAAASALTRATSRQWPTWLASALAGLALFHLTGFAIPVRPGLLATVIALLSHAGVATATALFIGRRSPQRLFGDPLRRSALFTSALAVPLLLAPFPGLAAEWAAFAAGVATLWFVHSWVWRERGAFPASQAAQTLAALLGALAWVEGQDWWADGAGLRDPRVLHAAGVALALLGLAWVSTRRVTASNERLRELWHRDPFALDRVIVAIGILATIVTASLGTIPGAAAELSPAGLVEVAPPPGEFAVAYGPGAWLVLGLFALVVVSHLRLVTAEEPGDNESVLVAGVLALGVPIVWAGSYESDFATASALRWGLAATFLLGTTALSFRRPFATAVRRLGFRLRITRVATVGGYVCAISAAAVVLVLTLVVAEIGFSGNVPYGPGPNTPFARIGWTASNVGPLALLVVGLAMAAVRERSAGFAFAGGLVFLVTVTGGYSLSVVTAGGTIGDVESIRLGLAGVVAASAWALLWLAAGSRVPGGPLLAIQSAAGLAGVACLAAIPLVRLLTQPADPLPAAFDDVGRGGWVALALAVGAGFGFATRYQSIARPHVFGLAAAVAGVFVACSLRGWDEPGRGLSIYAMAGAWAAAGLALTAFARGPWVVLLTIGVALVTVVGPTPDAGRWPIPLALAVYAAAGAWVARNVTAGREWPLASLALTGLVVAGQSFVVATGAAGVAERLVGPLALGLVAISFGLIKSRVTSLATAVAAVALIGWAGPDPEGAALWLRRNAWAFVAIVMATGFAVSAFTRLFRAEWAVAARHVGRGLFPAAIGALVVILFQQVTAFDPVTKRTPLDFPAVLTVLAAIWALIAIPIRFALRPATDPYGLTESRRTIYVYLAELILVLFFVHVRFNLPELFIGQAVRYWTFIVMLLAYVGIGLAEWFDRRGVRVLSVPLRRTGALLPLIPLLAFWAKPPASLLALADERAPGLRPFLGYLEKLPQHFDSYAWLWFLAGTLYGLVSLSKRSFGWGLLGALAVNAGLWALLTHNGVSAAIHPQVWAIPLALIVLVSEHINRRTLPARVSSGLRYFGIGMLYVSSTADLFIAGVGESVWLPVVLAVFCVAGVFAGILLRVRAFLFLGAGFLLLDVFAMIWHAAVGKEQTWVWYASGIVLGVAILALFAVFEKRKDDVTRAMGKLREWD